MAKSLSTLMRAGLAVGAVGVGAGAIPVQAFLTARPAAADPRARNLGPGSTGIGVKCVQVGLNADLGTRIATDGVYGHDTTQTVVVLEKKYGLPQNGVVGPPEGSILMFHLDHDTCFGSVPTLAVSGGG